MSSLVRKIIGLDLIDQLNENKKSQGLDYLKRANILVDLNVKTCKKNNHFKINSSIFFCTHHSGAFDFLAGFPFISKHTHDLKIIVNKQLLILKALKDLFIGVEPVSSAKNNSMPKQEMVDHLRNNGSLMIFPSGKVGHKQQGVIQDFPWRYGIMDILNSHANFAVPVYIESDNGPLFYHVRHYFPKLSMLFLLASAKYSKNKNVKIIMGEPIPVKRLQGLEPKMAMEYIRNKTYELKNHLDEL